MARRADGVRFIKHHLGLSGWSVLWAAGVVRGGVIGSGIRAMRREIVGEKGDDELQSAFECACAVQFLHGGERHRFEQLDTGLAIRRVHAVQLHEVHEEIDRHAFAGTKGGGYMQCVLRVYFSPGFRRDTLGSYSLESSLSVTSSSWRQVEARYWARVLIFSWLKSSSPRPTR